MALRLGLVLLVLAGAGIVLGYPLVHEGPLDPLTLAADFYYTGNATLLGVALTVLILGGLYERRQKRQEKEWLMRNLRSRDNELALETVETMRERGWLFRGTLDGTRLVGANLQGAYLWGASLRRVNLSGATLASALLNGANLQGAYLEGTHLAEAILRQTNLEGAFLGDASLRDADLQGANLKDALRLTDEQLARTYTLRGATMPEGNRYDGRYRLAGDLESMKAQNVGTEDRLDIAHWYGVPPAEYVKGQVWADKYLEELLSESTEDTDTKRFGLSTEPELNLDGFETNILRQYADKDEDEGEE